MAKTLLQIAVGNCSEIVAKRLNRAERRETGVGAAAMEGDMLVDEGVEQRAGVGGEGAGGDEMIAERPLLFEDPGVHRRDELVRADEIHLHGENAEKKISIGGGAGHGGDRVTGMSFDGRHVSMVSLLKMESKSGLRPLNAN